MECTGMREMCQLHGSSQAVSPPELYCASGAGAGDNDHRTSLGLLVMARAVGGAENHLCSRGAIETALGCS